MVTATTTYLHHATGKEMVDILDECFVRVQRSFIVAAHTTSCSNPSSWC